MRATSAAVAVAFPLTNKVLGTLSSQEERARAALRTRLKQLAAKRMRFGYDRAAGQGRNDGQPQTRVPAVSRGTVGDEDPPHGGGSAGAGRRGIPRASPPVHQVQSASLLFIRSLRLKEQSER
jgi:hypothetical protein